MGDQELTLLRPRAHRLHLPVLQPAADADGRGEHRAAAAHRRPEGGPGLGGRGDQQGRPRRPPQPPPGAALRRPAAAGGDRPRAGLTADGDVRRRADRQPRLPTSEEILELLREAVESYGQTTVMVTHDARASAMADRILFLADGLIVARPGPRQRAGRADGHGGGRRAVTWCPARPVGRKTRAVLTVISIVLGTAMIAGTFVVRDQITRRLRPDLTESGQKIDVHASQADRVHQRQRRSGRAAAGVGRSAQVAGGRRRRMAEGQIQAAGRVVITASTRAPAAARPVWCCLASPTRSTRPRSCRATHPRGRRGRGQLAARRRQRT